MHTPVVALPETSNEQSLRLLSRIKRSHRGARAPLSRPSRKRGTGGAAKFRRGQGDLDRTAQRTGRVQEERIQIPHQRAGACRRTELRADAARISALRRNWLLCGGVRLLCGEAWRRL